MLLVLKEDQNRWGCTPRGSGRRKGPCACPGGSAEVGALKEELKGSVQRRLGEQSCCQPPLRFECICFCDEANTLSFVLTLVPCSAHPPPLLLEHLLRSHLPLCSPSSAFWGGTLIVAYPMSSQHVPSLSPRTGTHGIAVTEWHLRWGQGHCQSQHKRELKKHPHCAC